uniref:C2H2-type domain-containing protein n=1 Tax=Wuchereria bancrofti TaxID=6293 RepID=A0AAF5PQN2_WUCBA
MTQIIWFSFLLCIASAETSLQLRKGLKISTKTRGNSEVVSISLVTAIWSRFWIQATDDGISFDSSHFDFTDLWKTEHRSRNSQLQELSRTDDENMHSSVSSDPLHFLDFTHLRKIEDASTEQPEIKTDLVTAKNLELFVLQNPTITDKKNYECPHVGCTMKTKSRKEYIAHRKTHPKPFIYERKMPGCGLTFNHPSSFYDRQKTGNGP